MTDNRNDGRSAPVSYRLPPHTKVKAGCWPVVLLILTMLACPGAAAVRIMAEPLDLAGCKLDCEREDMEFARYVYRSDDCFCLRDGVELQLY